ncbi:transporter substrate-binding domain-containing protein [Vibrio profundum]|uniref:substrate-binding periplasmic protein n=1 Tax=Vibrio profundum TaxID=2910247 RepID=UPI003D0F74C7
MKILSNEPVNPLSGLLRIGLWQVATTLILSMVSFSLTAQPLKITTVDIVPGGFVGKNGRPAGMFYDVANKIAETAKVPYLNVLKPYARVVKDLESGEADITLLVSNPNLEGKVIKVAPIFTDKNVLVGKPSLNIRSFEDLHGKKVAIIRGVIYSTKFELDKNINKVEVNNYRQSVGLFLKGRVDAIIGPTLPLGHELNNYGYDWDDLGTPYVISSKQIWLFMSNKSNMKNMVNKLSDSVSLLHRNGGIEEIVFKYTGKNNAVTFY